MLHLRVAPFLLLAVSFSAPGQSVRSTHSGLIYFFDGYVFVGDERLQQKFGHFPDICQGCELRTELGHAEVVLTPGVMLRIGENSAIRMLSTSLSDTRIELLRGSAILEVSLEAENPPDTLIFKSWKVRIPKEGVSRIDSDPAQVRVLSGTAEVSSETETGIVTARRGDVLPLASVLVPEPATTPAEDAFSNWAMNRSSAIAEDNTIAAGIIDDPDQLDSSGQALGGYTYFPATGIPSLGITSPYGVSFWSPYQSFNAGYFPAYPYGYPYGYLPYGYLRSGFPGGTRFIPIPRPIGITPGNIQPGRPIGGSTLPRIPVMPAPRTAPAVAPHSPVPHVIHR